MLFIKIVKWFKKCTKATEEKLQMKRHLWAPHLLNFFWKPSNDICQMFLLNKFLDFFPLCIMLWKAEETIYFSISWKINSSLQTWKSNNTLKARESPNEVLIHTSQTILLISSSYQKNQKPSQFTPHIFKKQEAKFLCSKFQIKDFIQEAIF